MSKLPADCLNEIFEYLEEDKNSLRSCLLVNRLWCEVSVRILWRNIRNYNTLIACLPNESKEILYKNGIITSTSTSNPPMFNYSSFCKVLSVYQIEKEIGKLLENQQSNSSQDPKNIIVIQEIFKLLMNQISLKKIEFYNSLNIPNFTLFPGAKGCFKNLTELNCDLYISSEIFYQLSQICHNIQSLSVDFEKVISNGLADLISVQQNLKHLNMQFYDCELLPADITALLTNLPDTLTKLELYGGDCNIPLSFIAKLTNLQEITLSFEYLLDFKKLQHVTFSHLQVLKFEYESPRNEFLIKFLENNGRNLKEFFVNYSINNSLNLAIAKFCPNLRNLFTGFRVNEIETLKLILNSCQYLKNIQVRCCGDYLSEKEILESIVKYSSKNIHELKLCYSFNVESELLPEELESIFADWENCIPQKSLSLIVICNDSDTLDKIDENMKIIEKYIKLGIIKEFKTIGYYWYNFI